MAFLLPFFTLAFLLPLQPVEGRVAPAAHPFYISVTEINQNAAEKSLEVSCRFFADDFEQTLEQVYHTPLDISSAKEKATFDKLIPDYINKHLLFAADGKRVALNYVGYEKEKESAYCYFEVTGITSVKELEAVNLLLHEFRKDQINIMHVTVGGKRQSTKLDYPASKANFRF